MPKNKDARHILPREEWPYEVPGNWIWTRLGDAYEINPKNSADDDTMASFIPMEKISAGMVSEFTYDIQSWGKAKKGHTHFADGDVAFAKISPCFENRKSMILKDLVNGIGAGTTELIVLRQAHIHNQYTFWFISSEEFIRGGANTYSGTVGQQRIGMAYVKGFPIPLPPPPEQQRIVARIESLFDKLDAAEGHIKDALEKSERLRASVLHLAFTGELTKKWREDHGVGMESWIPSTSTDLFEYVTSGSRGWAQYYSDSGAVFIRMGNLEHGTIELDMTDTQYVNLPDKAEGQRSLVQKGDILISITADVGMIGLVRDIDFEGYINQHIALARPTDKESAEFIAWYLVSDVGLSQLRKKQRGATKVGLGLNDIRGIILNIPSKEEQREIVRILGTVFSSQKRVKEISQNSLSRIADMKKSLLSLAFRGQLGTNNPAEESMESVLLASS